MEAPVLHSLVYNIDRGEKETNLSQPLKFFPYWEQQCNKYTECIYDGTSRTVYRSPAHRFHQNTTAVMLLQYCCSYRWRRGNIDNLRTEQREKRKKETRAAETKDAKTIQG